MKHVDCTLRGRYLDLTGSRKQEAGIQYQKILPHYSTALNWAGPGKTQVADACECGNEPSGSVKCGEFLD